ncbi:MAG: beta-ketoacyl-[acyl-carrier-protein] synthase family protein [Anaerolineales bacterium]|jgi:beta-ketoacyl-acyl-carrier-protein synthase II
MARNHNDLPRVVVTGLGALSPLGSVDAFWENLKAGRSGIRRITLFDPSELNVQIAGEVDFEPDKYIDRKSARRMSRASQLALVAARMAQEDAGLTKEAVASQGDRIGVSIGTANAGFGTLVDISYEYTIHGRKPFPTSLINGLPNMPGYYVSLEMGALGPLTTISTACASGTQSIGYGLELIQLGKADLVFSGGVDCLVREEVIVAFDAMTVLARSSNETPGKASRPFDSEREGFVLGEGAGFLVLESLEHALRRDAHIYAEVLGYAASSDAQHIATPDESGFGAQNAMRWALADAHLGSDQMDYINAHGTGTRINDPTETNAIKQVFGEKAYQIPISSTKSMIGHCMGASGTLEAIACVKSLQEGILHPTINLETPDPECDLDYIPNQSREVEIQTALSNSFGLGGQNACLVLGKNLMK